MSDAARRRAQQRLGEIIPTGHRGVVARCADCPATCFCWDAQSAEQWADEHWCGLRAVGSK